MNECAECGDYSIHVVVCDLCSHEVCHACSHAHYAEHSRDMAEEFGRGEAYYTEDEVNRDEIPDEDE